MRILVIGAGRTGLFWTTLFSRAGADVTLLMKPDQLAKFPDPTDPVAFGIEWRIGQEDCIQWPARKIRTIDQIKATDPHKWWVVVPAVRDYAIEQVLRPVVAHFGPMIDALVIPTNGIVGEFAARCVFPRDDRIISATLTYPCELDPQRPGWTRVLRPIERGGIGLAPYGDFRSVAAHQRAMFDRIIDRLCSIQHQHGPEVSVYPIMYEMKLTKLLLNMIGNAIPAILDCPGESVYRDLRLCRLELKLIAEFLMSMRSTDQRGALNFVDLPGYPRSALRPLFWLARLEQWFGRTGLPSWLYQQQIAPRILRARGGKAPSLFQELAAGRNLCENFHRDFARITQAMSGYLPSLHDRLGEILDRCFAHPKVRAHYRSNPDQLVGDLENQQAVDWRPPFSSQLLTLP